MFRASSIIATHCTLTNIAGGQ